jgi:hypothetical protein
MAPKVRSPRSVGVQSMVVVKGGAFRYSSLWSDQREWGGNRVEQSTWTRAMILSKDWQRVVSIQQLRLIVSHPTGLRAVGTGSRAETKFWCRAATLGRSTCFFARFVNAHLSNANIQSLDTPRVTAGPCGLACALHSIICMIRASSLRPGSPAAPHACWTAVAIGRNYRQRPTLN